MLPTNTNTKRYKFLEHTTDVEFESYGRTLKEAIENAALAMFETCADTHKIKPAKRVPIKEKARNLEELVAFTLSDLLSQGEALELYFREFKINFLEENDKEWVLEGTAFGARQRPDLYRMVVKAVTLHGEKAERRHGKWVLRLVLDI
ncbi:MAG TPA: archease [Candidatus Norongarragalinales archaeon]|jgi:SHS2 domain-containing protein|nr:archease [Candidatus Norongarragalinales archaeon]